MIPKSRAQLIELVREKLATCVKCGACHAFCPVFLESRREGAGMRGKLALLQAWLEGRSIPEDQLSSAIGGSLDCFACRAACANAVDIPAILPIARMLLSPGLLERWTESSQEYGDASRAGISRADTPIFLVATSTKGDDIAPDLCNKLSRGGLSLSPFPALSEQPPNRFSFDPIGLGVWGNALLQALHSQPPSKLVVSDPSWLFQARLLETLYILSDDEKDLLKRICDLSGFLNDAPYSSDAPKRRGWTWHDPCISARVLGIKAQPRRLLSRLLEQPLIETTVDGACCGARGAIDPAVAGIASNKLQERVEQLCKPGVDGVVTSCSLCATRLSEPLAKRGILLRTLPEFLLEDHG